MTNPQPVKKKKRQYVVHLDSYRARHKLLREYCAAHGLQMKSFVSGLILGRISQGAE